jgi:hypothetical protein
MDLSELIPAWLVAASWIYAGFIWIFTRRTQIRLDSTIWGVTFALVGLLYLAAYLPREPSVADELTKLQGRIFVTRILMLVLSFSQWLPLTISYLRKVKRDELNGNSHSSGRIG